MATPPKKTIKLEPLGMMAPECAPTVDDDAPC